MEELDHFENGGVTIQGHPNAGATQEQGQGQAQFTHAETFAPYYQERARYTGAWD